MVQLHLPTGINYDCTNCGKCCAGWAVPMTEEDYERISDVDWGQLNPIYRDRPLFRELKKQEREGSPYTHKILADNPACPFLVENNLCFIHSKRGAEFKPSICQLFPYSFNETPSGVYATVSFVSTGTILNAGKPLTDQTDVINAKWNEFKRLYPNYQPDWSHTKLTADQPLSWNEYLAHEQKLFEFLSDEKLSLEERLLRGSAYLVEQVKRAGTTNDSPVSAAGPTATVTAPTPLKPLDKDLLVVFHKMYFPTKTLKTGECDFNVLRLVNQALLGKKALSVPSTSYSFETLMSVEFPQRDPEIENLLYRYIYSFIFGKKYFGAGFGQVSVIGGFHHLILLVALIKLSSRASALMRGQRLVSLLDVAASVRQSEKLVGETKLGGYAAAVWEMMLFSPMRARRFLANC